MSCISAAAMGACSGSSENIVSDACVALTCESESAQCGVLLDGCGGELQCGRCDGTDLCNVDNQCECVPETCDLVGKNCGTITDGCNSNLNCGTCTGVDNCGGGGVDNVCGCTPLACQANECGILNDQCDGTVDCGECPCDEFPLVDTCTNDDICINAQCVAAFDRSYEVSVGLLTINSLSPTGTAWDTLGGAPDPFVEVLLNGSEVFRSGIEQNVFAGSFADTATFTIQAGSNLQFTAWDADVTTDDWIIGCIFDHLSAATLSGQVLTCNGTAETGTLGTTLQIQFVPQ